MLRYYKLSPENRNKIKATSINLLSSNLRADFSSCGFGGNAAYPKITQVSAKAAGWKICAQRRRNEVNRGCLHYKGKLIGMSTFLTIPPPNPNSKSNQNAKNRNTAHSYPSYYICVKIRNKKGFCTRGSSGWYKNTWGLTLEPPQ